MFVTWGIRDRCCMGALWKDIKKSRSKADDVLSVT